MQGSIMRTQGAPRSEKVGAHTHTQPLVLLRPALLHPPGAGVPQVHGSVLPLSPPRTLLQSGILIIITKQKCKNGVWPCSEFFKTTVHKLNTYRVQGFGLRPQVIQVETFLDGTWTGYGLIQQWRLRDLKIDAPQIALCSSHSEVFIKCLHPISEY